MMSINGPFQQFFKVWLEGAKVCGHLLQLLTVLIMKYYTFFWLSQYFGVDVDGRMSTACRCDSAATITSQLNSIFHCWWRLYAPCFFHNSQSREQVNSVRVVVSGPGNIRGFVLDGQS